MAPMALPQLSKKQKWCKTLRQPCSQEPKILSLLVWLALFAPALWQEAPLLAYGCQARHKATARHPARVQLWYLSENKSYFQQKTAFFKDLESL
jgi:hypothetical protein